VTDQGFLSDVVRFDLPRLGDISGLRGVHLQCHIGTDTISLARLGGADEWARLLRGGDRAGRDAGRPDRCRGRFPRGRCVRRGRGARRGVVRPGLHRDRCAAAGCSSGRATRCCGRWRNRGWTGCCRSTSRISRWSSRRSGPTAVPTSTDVEFTQNVSMEWNHGLGETVTALLNAGLDLTALAEHDSVPWEALPGQMTKDSAGEWRLIDRPERLAASYTLQAWRRD
jgi:hypothetical protein